MNKNKRLLSFFLAVVMILGMFPLTAFAEDGATQPSTEATVGSCEFCPGEDGKHSTGCPTLCECETKPAEGEAHAVGCPLNLTPVTTSLGDETTGTTSSTTQGTTTGTTAATTQATTTATEGTTEGTTAPTTKPTDATTAPTTKPTDATTAPTTKPTDATTAPTTQPTTAPTTQPTDATTAPTTQPTTAPTESTKTFAETLLEIDSLSDLLIEICKEENLNAVLALSTEEIVALQKWTDDLHAQLESPTQQNNWDYDDLWATYAVLPNAPEVDDFQKHIYLPDPGSLLSVENVDDLLKINKTISGADGGREYKLTLDAYTTMEYSGKITDLVLVLDQSGSMFHAADVGSTKHTFVSQGTGDRRKTYTTYINNSMTFDQMEKEAAAAIANGNNGPAMTGYYMARVGSQLYALRRGTKNGQVYWYRTNDYDYSTTDGEGDTKGYPGTVDVEEGKVKRYSEYATHSWTDSGHDQAQCYKSIYGVTYDALQAFLNEIKGTPNLRVAIVGFAGPGDSWNGTGVYNDGQWYQFGDGFSYSKIENGNYFKETWDTAEMANLEASIDAFWPRYNSTYTVGGFNIASMLFENDGGSQEDESQKNHIIMLFSDGQPTGNGDPSDVVKNYLKKGKNKDGVKCGYTPEIYTVGPVCKHSDVTALEEWATDSKHYFAPSIENMNTAFKQIASSIIATTLTLNENAYLYDGITASFQIPEEVLQAYNSATTDEAKQAVLKNNIKVYTEDAKFVGTTLSFTNKKEYMDAKLVFDPQTNSVSVSNFNYSKNYVTNISYVNPDTPNSTNKNFNGRKLIVEIPIEAKPDFIGGGNVPTNTDDSGIYYSNGEVVKTYTSQSANITVVPITPEYTNGAIYISQEADIPHLTNIGEFFTEDTPDDEPWQIDGINNGYVEITYTITAPDGKSMSLTIPKGTTYRGLDSLTWTGDLSLKEVLTANTTYTVSCDVVSSNNANNKANTLNSSTIYVYKPVVTFRDSAIELGEKAKYDGNTTGDNLTQIQNYVSVEWLNNEVAPTEEHLRWLGEAPTLEYSYAPSADAFKEETAVQITNVWSKQDPGLQHNVPADFDLVEGGYVTFKRAGDSDYTDCSHKTESTVDITGETWVNFVVHVKSFDLTIVKRGADTEADPNQTFVFHIEGPVNKTVVINGNGSVTITGLPVGNYTVTEDTSWSWRYSCDNAEQDVLASQITGGAAERTFTNTRTDDKWLDGNTHAVNNFTAQPVSVTP